MKTLPDKTVVLQKAEKGLKWAMVRLLTECPFWGTLALFLPFVEGGTRTMATDGEKVYYSPEFVADILDMPAGKEKLLGVVAHELYHIALGHIWRRGNRDFELFNIAADFAVNLLVEKHFRLPEGALLDRRFEEKTAEEIYRILQQEMSERSPAPSPSPAAPEDSDISQNNSTGEENTGDQGIDNQNGSGARNEERQDSCSSQNKQGCGGNSGNKQEIPDGGIHSSQACPNTNAAQNNINSGNVPGSIIQRTIDDHSLWRRVSRDPAKMSELEKKWDDYLIRAAAADIEKKLQGTLPAGLYRKIQRLRNPKADWRTLLAAFISQSKIDYSFNPPDRRFINGAYGDIILPDFNDQTVRDIVIAIDTSGSVSKKEMEQYLGEINAIMTLFPLINGYLIACDAEVQGVWEIDSHTNLKNLKIKGCGGTDFRPVFKEIEKRNLLPSALIYLTDGYGTFPENPPWYPVVWVLVGKTRPEAPWGQTVEFEI
ncbi:DUF2201 family putative metallopeptidase [Koleobacter methoxysyntrophicus]|uniref:vWA domain-containing protein n=1 Tax=Koleobacter methoxysyntrophicus TaxID=2751313 RepID=UPI0019D5E3F1|nr:VWA-like domain-containing protein [Koleobacter methoxysyntrophicus]